MQEGCRVTQPIKDKCQNSVRLKEGPAMPKLKGNKPPPNALKYGVFAETIILPGEDPKEFEQLHRDLIQEWLPSGPAEHDAVLTLAKCMWRKRRIRYLKQAFSSEDAQKLNKLALRCTFAGENVAETLKQLSDKALHELEEMIEKLVPSR
jgi:hypothetical protein